MYRFAALCAIALLPALAADPAAPSISKVFDQQLSSFEKEFVPLVEAMPADKFGFAPKDGEFKNVRTFGQQASHVAYVNYAVAAAVLGEKNPSETGPHENGPASLNGKDAIVKYVKESFAYAHKAMAKLNEHNLTDLVQSPFESGKATRIYMANVAVWHSYDHYGQMVVYARMNKVVPPASR